MTFGQALKSGLTIRKNSLVLKLQSFSLRLISILFIIGLSKIEEDIILSLVGKKLLNFQHKLITTGNSLLLQMKMLREMGCFLLLPADFSFVCLTELGDLQEQYEALKSLWVEVYLVSTDTHLCSQSLA